MSTVWGNGVVRDIARGTLLLGGAAATVALSPWEGARIVGTHVLTQAGLLGVFNGISLVFERYVLDVKHEIDTGSVIGDWTVSIPTALGSSVTSTLGLGSMIATAARVSFPVPCKGVFGFALRSVVPMTAGQVFPFLAIGALALLIFAQIAAVGERESAANEARYNFMERCFVPLQGLTAVAIVAARIASVV